MTIDPHKWLFSPYDCAAILYRDPSLARRTFTQRAGYLDVLTEGRRLVAQRLRAPPVAPSPRAAPPGSRSPSTAPTRTATPVDATIARTEEAADLIRACDHLELVLEPELSVVVFRRLGWERADYERWSERLLTDQVGFVVPTTWRGETVLRFCITNPRTTLDDVRACLPD
jgi:L-2,4-diaminobutyrate decarboxylase